MMDLLVDKSIEALKYELMKTNVDGANPFYQNKFIEFVTNKSISPVTPNLTIGVVEGDSIPVNFAISSMIAQTAEQYTIQYQLIVRAVSEGDAKEYRRILTQRIKHAFMRRNGKFRELLLGLVDEEEGYREVVMDYKLVQTRFDSEVVSGEFLYISVIELSFKTDVSYNETT